MVLNELLIPHNLEDICKIIDDNELSKTDLGNLIGFLLTNYDLDIPDNIAAIYYRNIGSSIMLKIHKLVTETQDLDIEKPSDIKTLIDLSQQLIDYSKPSKKSTVILDENDSAVFDMLDNL